MALGSGTRIGAYEILSLVGAGGMGEVYRAHDPRLARNVAIKILPAAISADAVRLRRFEQEARAAPALNHPNIVTIYSVEQVDGLRDPDVVVGIDRDPDDVPPKATGTSVLRSARVKAILTY